MSRRKPRTLSAEDRKLWSAVTRTVNAKGPESQTEAPSSPAKPEDSPPKTKQHFDVTDFRIGETATTRTPGSQLAPSVSERLAHAPVRMDHGTHKKMVRGRLKPEARIDLHGMTLAQAHPALTRFIMNAHDSGKRLVLVITGKGKDRDDPGPIPIRRGVLKHQVPNWLHTPPLGRVVLDVREAHFRHGGTGAYYVYLSRAR
ncbi:DNA mismatch repair protein MutS [Rhodobacteraceae bacterium W635]|uniref:Smr/MutS family protein n=1 Tax=Nioella halotolerans TaxID=2303578 RepID=UPI000E3EB3BA|nr:DNA mismatch repair protein MutS [Rhodobacteraceae bacterium W635]